MKSYKTCKILKNKKRSVFFSAYLFGFLFFFFRFFITLCFSNILASSIFLGVMCVPEFFGDQWTEYNISHGQISGFQRKQLILLNVFDLILLFLRRFLIFFIFFFYLYPYLFFLKLWFTFFSFNTFYSRLLNTKIWSFFFSAYLFGFLLFVDSSSHYVSLSSSHLLFFFCFMFVLEFFGDQWTDSSYSSYILTQISLMLFFRTYKLEMKSF